MENQGQAVGMCKEIISHGTRFCLVECRISVADFILIPVVTEVAVQIDAVLIISIGNLKSVRIDYGNDMYFIVFDNIYNCGIAGAVGCKKVFKQLQRYTGACLFMTVYRPGNEYGGFCLCAAGVVGYLYSVERPSGFGGADLAKLAYPGIIIRCPFEVDLDTVVITEGRFGARGVSVVG